MKVQYCVNAKVIGEEQEVNRFFEYAKDEFYDESLDRKSNLIKYRTLLHAEAPNIEVFYDIQELSKIFPELHFICMSSDMFSDYSICELKDGECGCFQIFPLDPESLSHEFDVDEFEMKRFGYLFDEVLPKISTIRDLHKYRDLYQKK